MMLASNLCNCSSKDSVLSSVGCSDTLDCSAALWLKGTHQSPSGSDTNAPWDLLPGYPKSHICEVGRVTDASESGLRASTHTLHSQRYLVCLDITIGGTHMTTL